MHSIISVRASNWLLSRLASGDAKEDGKSATGCVCFAVRGSCQACPNARAEVNANVRVRQCYARGALAVVSLKKETLMHLGPPNRVFKIESSL